MTEYKVVIDSEDIQRILEGQKLIQLMLLDLQNDIKGIGFKPPVKIEPKEPTIVTFDFDSFIQGNKGILQLPLWMDNKEVVIRSKGWLKTKVTALVGNNTKLTFENWESTPQQMFDVSDSEELGIRGICFVCPPNRPIVTAFPSKSVFGWERDSVQKGKFAYIDVPIISDVDRVTFGLCGFGYSSKSNDRIYLIAENFNHNGFNFTQIKNPYNGNLWLILKDVTIHNPIIEEPQSHYYSPTRIKVRISVKDGIATIISDNTFDQIKTWKGYNNGNQRSIVHFDRYAYDISDLKLINNKNLIIDWLVEVLGYSEFHPLDTVAGFGTVVRKQIDESRITNWDYDFEGSKDVPTKVTLPEGKFDAFIVYKGNALFQSPAIDKDTKFGEDYWQSGIVTSSQGYGWSWYNNEFSGVIQNFNIDQAKEDSGYFRNSTGSGITQGLSIINSKFGKNGPLETAKLEKMPTEASDFVSYLRSIK